ncbi:endonuclease/exonuclease/phosphatase family protein [Haloferula chungangensis]|uniref:Endonuclease/exonuclease/phosphatase family protein n=1 Tax=Haloferula chungangensis TaxID=1048331 RepID=A0ABW2L972_9BACT
MRSFCWVPLIFALLTGACRKEAPPKTVAVREDGVLELTLCSFNVRYEGDQDKSWKSWPNRVDRVVRSLREIDPDVFGIQEALHGQAADLRASMTDYEFFGVGRDDGRRDGEYAAILWKADRFAADVEDQGTFWLSDTPGKPGSKSWGNSVVRVATWVRLGDRATGRSFYVFNTHWDHRSQSFRERAAPMMAARIDGRKHPEDPVVLLGDFNATRGNPAVDYFVGERVNLAGKNEGPWPGAMKDPYQVLKGSERNRRTLHLWEADAGTRLDRLKVDHIFVSGNAKLMAAGISKAATREAQASDHYPVWARVAWEE